MTDNSAQTHNVVSMSRFQSNQQFPVISQVEAYWQALSTAGAIPMRADIDPRGIERALEYTFVLERIAPRVARIRLSGMHLNDLMDMEVRGMPLTALFGVPAREEIAAVLETVFTSPATALLTLVSPRGIGAPALDARMLLLPLQSTQGVVDRALGCLVSNGAIGRGPRRFEVSTRKITRLGALAPEKAPLRPRSFAEDQAPYSPAKAERPDASRPALRLVYSSNSD